LCHAWYYRAITIVFLYYDSSVYVCLTGVAMLLCNIMRVLQCAVHIIFLGICQIYCEKYTRLRGSLTRAKKDVIKNFFFPKLILVWEKFNLLAEKLR
jgi:hypothetical protein